MNKRDKARFEVWQDLKQVAIPDSRFHYDFGEFIPDFMGSYQALRRLVATSLYQEADFVFVAPDNCLESLRKQALDDGKDLLVPTYGIRRGFVLLEKTFVTHKRMDLAATLDGMERFGTNVSLLEIQKREKVDLLVTGASVINPKGIRFGKGHGYFDLEWAMLFMIGVVSETTPVVAFVHDCQLKEIELQASEFDTVCDLVVTPQKTIEVEKPNKPTVGILWEKLEPGMIADIPPLQELRSLVKKGGEDEL